MYKYILKFNKVENDKIYFTGIKEIHSVTGGITLSTSTFEKDISDNEYEFRIKEGKFYVVERHTSNRRQYRFCYESNIEKAITSVINQEEMNKALAKIINE